MTQEDGGSAPMLGSVVEPPIANHYDGRMWVEADRYTELLEKYAALVSETRWIPVTERLPPHDETVLFTCDLGPNEGFTDVAAGRWEGMRNDMGLPAMSPVYGDEDDWGPCSHWVPLPAPPTARK
jgi:hypothetical protein